MYAVVETGGKQYHVTVGDTLDVEKVDARIGEKVDLDRVLLVSGEDQVEVGRPVVPGARVRARVVHQGRTRKTIVFKYKPKKRYRRKAGHRQAYTRLQVEEITV